jgi:Asp-tRNA(Asn)/Glu-tRNA(Gln) amidotransferase A subunit family amidase
VGLQVVGRWRDDAGVVRAAGAFERATIAQRRLPPVLAHASA